MEQLPVVFKESWPDNNSVVRVSDLLSITDRSIGTATEFGSTMEILIDDQGLVEKTKYFANFGRIKGLVIGIQYTEEPAEKEDKPKNGKTGE